MCRQINYGIFDDEIKTDEINQALNTNLRNFLGTNNFPLALNDLNHCPGVVTEIFDNDLCPIPGSLFNEVFKILHPI
jgi:hypothetical protein